MSINWNNIRAIEGQREGFEELVCQLVGQEKIDKQVKFTRIGKPDGGKECYWELKDGKIHCWQAKYFTNSLSDNQWSQVDKSVKTAIDHHPKLKKYYIAIPIDRPDGKGRGKSMLQKWKDHVTQWKSYASSKKMKVDFEYWGKHELETRLRKPENEGLIYYFFNERELTDEWFNTKNQDSIDALGGRYTPELNFELPFIGFLNGFERSHKFINQMNAHYGDFLSKHRRLSFKKRKEDLKAEISKLDKVVSSLKKIFESLTLKGVDKIPFEELEKCLTIINKYLEFISDKYQAWREEEEKSKREKGEKVDYSTRPYSNELNQLGQLSGSVYKFTLFLDSTTCKLTNNPYLIVLGEAGKGKSHTLADIVTKRKKEGKTSLLLLGENFSNSDMPWTQILRNQLRFEGNEDKFLGALNAKAESMETRLLVIIDALNEGKGRDVWPKKLKSFIRSFSKYPWLGLIVSVRSSFEKLIAPVSDIDDSIASRINHPGFEGVEYSASLHFFKHYGINPVNSPFLHPEFQNPLFLKLFCEGLEKKGLTEVPEGYHGISTIIEYYLEGIEHKLSQPDQLDYDIRLKLLRKSVDGILVKMLEEEQDHLHYVTGEEITRNIFSGKCGSDDKQYLNRLISEGVINEDLYWADKSSYDGIHFAYQRFQDHLIVSALLDKHLDKANPEKSFASGPLRTLLEDDESQALYYNQNLIEALSIQVPERVGKELHEVAPYAANYFTTAEAFIEGLMWRRTDTVGANSLKYFNEVLRHEGDLNSQFLEMSISMATKSDFYFNADWLHKNLFKQSLSQRDSWWTTWLQDKYGQGAYHNPVKRLIDWAWDESPKNELPIESRRLAAVILAWFLTSSNRYLRDSATKALVSLLQNRISTLLDVLKQFEGVNDPYVCERLYAVAFGCALRTQDKQSLIPLVEYIYKTIFDTEFVYPHILLRDYARGVIEYAEYLELELKPEIKVDKIRPPFKSVLPDSFPTNDEIDAKYAPKGEEGHYGGSKWGATAILHSMTTEYGRGGGYGDFGRYTFQSALSDWEVNYDGLSNYAIERIFDLGYDPDIFTEFDSRQPSGRGSGHKERIGKKYQWITFYEILAKVADNCKFNDAGSSAWNDYASFIKYDGPWNPYVRDIDPTILIKETQKENYIENNEELPWWVPLKYENWQQEAEPWLNRFDDFPPIEDLITVKDSEGVEWLNLDIMLDWRNPKKPGEDSWDTKGKRLWYELGTWLVQSKELKKLLKVDTSDNPWRNWLPSLPNRYEVFSREYYWSPASLFFQINRYHGGDALPKKLEDRETGAEIATVHRTAFYFLWEEEFDCSKEEAIAYHKPSLLLSFGLKPSHKEGQYLNEMDEIVCFDPSVYEKGPTCLLMRKDHLLKTLKGQKLNLVWVIQGEKQFTGFGKNLDDVPDIESRLGGFYYMDEKGKITGNLRGFIEKYE